MTGLGTAATQAFGAIPSVSSCPTAVGGIAYLTTEYGLCGGNGTGSWFGAYWDSATTAPTAGHFTMWGNSSRPGVLAESGYSPSGTGLGVATTTGTHPSGNCAKWDASGNVIDAGAPCGSGSSGAGVSGSGSLTFGAIADGTCGTDQTFTLTGVTAGGAFQPGWPATFPTAVSGIMFASATNTITVRACNLSGASVTVPALTYSALLGGGGSGGGGSTISTPSTTTVGNVPQYSNTTGTALSTGLGLVTTVGSPGLDTNIASEKAVRTAIAGVTGSLPAQTGTASYLLSNGTSASWGNIATGGSGALDCATTPGVCDIVTAIVPFKGSANNWSGLNTFSLLSIPVGTPTSSTAACTAVGLVEHDNSYLYVCLTAGIAGAGLWSRVALTSTGW